MEEKIKIFKEYVNLYDQNNELVKLKYEHTLRVVNFCKEIGEELELDEKDMLLIKTIGLLHDVARFEQVVKYQTFNDSKSFDHGDYALTIIDNDELIKKIVVDVDIEILKKAIQYHNKFTYDNKLDERTILFCKIIRDADKLDILDLSIQNKISNQTLDTRMSDETYEELMNHHMINFENNKSELDRRLSAIGFVFDLNFDCSIKYIVDNDIFNKLIDKFIKSSPQESKRLEKIRTNTLEYIERRIERVR